MKICVYAVLTLLALSIAASSAVGKTVSGTISESAQIVPGNSFSAYVVGGEIVTSVQDDAAPSSRNQFGIAPLIRVSFEMQRSWYLVKRVTWDKTHRQLTIDF